MIETLNPDEVVFKNNVEKEAFYWLDKTFKPDRILYEPFSIHSPAGTYTPDVVMIINNRLIMIEVKSSWKAPGAARTKRSLKDIASRYNWLGYYYALIVKKKHQKDRVVYVDEWKIEEVRGNRLYVVTQEHLLNRVLTGEVQ